MFYNVCLLLKVMQRMNINEDSIHKQKNDIDERIKRLEEKLKTVSKLKLMQKDKAYCNHQQNLRDNLYHEQENQQSKKPKSNNEITSREKLQRALTKDFKESQTLPLHERKTNVYQKNQKEQINSYINTGEQEKTRKRSQSDYYNSVKSTSNQQLMEIMKNILQGQKKLQMEIKNIKNQHQYNQKEPILATNPANNIERAFQYRETFSRKPKQPIIYQESYYQPQMKPTNNQTKIDTESRGKSPYFRPQIKNKHKSNNKILRNLSKSKDEINYLIQYSDQISPNQSGYQHKKRAVSTKRANIRKQNKQAQELKFMQMMNMLRFHKDKKQRICIKAQLKTKAWQQVYKRIQQSQKQFKSAKKNVSRNFEQHLLSAIELQNKMKKQLINKIYSHCNSYVYK